MVDPNHEKRRGHLELVAETIRNNPRTGGLRGQISRDEGAGGKLVGQSGHAVHIKQESIAAIEVRTEDDLVGNGSRQRQARHALEQPSGPTRTGGVSAVVDRVAFRQRFQRRRRIDQRRDGRRIGSGVSDQIPSIRRWSSGGPDDPRGGIGIDRRSAAAGRGLIVPLEIIVLRVRRKVTAVAQGDLFVERIGGKEFLQIALIQLRDDLDDLHVHTISRRSEGLAVAEQQGHITGAFAGRAERVTIDRGVGVRNFRQRRSADVDAF